MGTRAAAAALLGMSIVAGCSGGDGGEEADTTEAPSQAEALAEEVGCTEVERLAGGGSGWQEADVLECDLPGEAPVRFYASLTPEQRDAAVRLLGMGGGVPNSPCENWGTIPSDYIKVVAGDDWVAAAGGGAAEALLVERLSGRPHPGPGGVPVSTGQFGCLPPPTTR